MSDSDEFDYDSGGDWSDPDENGSDEDEEVKISNAFYEAEDIKKNEPQRALDLFLSVLEMDRNTSD
jgi:hypothetical protein